MVQRSDSHDQSAFRTALGRILRPVVRIMIARGWRFPFASDLLKELYVEVCNRHFQLGDKRLTDSRVSLLTGLQRKDVRSVRTRLEEHTDEQRPASAGPLARVLARWASGKSANRQDGWPRTLPRSAETGEASFEALVAEVSRDIHARTVLDELKRQNLVEHDQTKDTVTLVVSAYVPSGDDDALVGYYGANLGDHMEAATANLEAAPAPGPNFERAVHYNKLTPEALDELDALARRMQSQVLADLNNRALHLQERDAGLGHATGRFRCGAYVYRTPQEDPEEDDQQ